MSEYITKDVEAEQVSAIPVSFRGFWVLVNVVVGLVIVLFPLFWGGNSIIFQGLVSVLAYAMVAGFGVVLLSLGKDDFVRTLKFHALVGRIAALAILFGCYLLLQSYVIKIPSADVEKLFPFINWFFVVTIYFTLVLTVPYHSFVLRLWLPKQRRRVEERNILYRSCETDAVGEWFVTAIILSAVVAGVIATLQWVTKGAILGTFYFEENPSFVRQARLHWPFVNPNHLSTLLTVGVILSFARLLRFLQISKLSMGPEPTLSSRLRFIRSPERLGVHMLYLIVVVFLFMTNVLTLSRAGNFIMFASLFILYFFYSIIPVDVLGKRSRNKLSRLIQIVFKPTSFLLVCFFVIFLLLGENDEQRVYERVAYGLAAGYDELRLLLLRSSWRMFLDSWVFGVGGGCWSLVIPNYMTAAMAGWDFDYAHNDLMQFIAETGIVGGCFLIAISWLILRTTIMTWKNELIPVERLQIVGLGLAVLAPLIHSFVDFPLHLPAIAVIFAVLLALYLRNLKRVG